MVDPLWFGAVLVIFAAMLVIVAGLAVGIALAWLAARAVDRVLTEAGSYE